MSAPDLSVVMPNYNFGRFIGEAIEAVMCQSYPSFELIVVDDASTDNSIEVIEGFMRKYPQIKLLRNKKNMGAVSAFKRGAEVSSGKYLWSTASDDKTLPGFFAGSMHLLAQYPQAGFCCADVEVDDNGTLIESRLYLSRKPRYFTPEESVKLFEKDPFTPFLTHSIIVKRDAFFRAGGYLDLKWSADSFLFSVISFREGFCYLPEILTVMRVHPGQYGAMNAKKSGPERKLIAKMMDAALLPEYSDVLPMFRKTAPFSVYSWEVLMTALKEKKYRGFVSFKLLRFALFEKIIRRPLLRLLPMKFWRKVLNIYKLIKHVINVL